MKNANTNFKGRISLLIVSGLTIVINLFSCLYYYNNFSRLHSTDLFVFVPLVLIFLYTLILHKFKMVKLFTPIIYFIISAICIYAFFFDRFASTHAELSIALHHLHMPYINSDHYVSLVIILFILAGVWQILINIKNIIAIIASITAALPLLSLFIRYLGYRIEEGYFLHSLYESRLIFFYVTAILFALLVDPIGIIKIKRKVKIKSTPENELRAIKEKLEQNLISQEEYDAQRAEIISKL